MKYSIEILLRRRNHIPRREMAAKLASEDELSPDRFEIPPPSPTLRRTSVPQLSKSSSHFSPPKIIAIIENPRYVRRCRNPIPHRCYPIPRRKMGAKLAEEEDLSPENPTLPPSPTRKTLDLVSSIQFALALPVPVGGSTIHQRYKLKEAAGSSITVTAGSHVP